MTVIANLYGRNTHATTCTKDGNTDFNIPVSQKLCQNLDNKEKGTTKRQKVSFEYFKTQIMKSVREHSIFFSQWLGRMSMKSLRYALNV